MVEKKVDNDWKEKVEKEKQEQGKIEEEIPDIEPDFKFFISTLAVQAAIALGQMENPITNKKEQNLNQAKLIIDTLAMLKEKTTGNLNTEEDSLLENMLYQLRLEYVACQKGQSNEGAL